MLKRSKELELEIERQSRQEAEKIKLLLLGAGESGKSTIFKQMKVIYGIEYSEAERKQQAPTIYSNVLTAMKILCDQAVVFNLVANVIAQEQFQIVRNLDENVVITIPIGDAIKALWNDPGIQAVWARRNEFQVIESVQYYFKKIDEIKMPNYLPDKDDILYSRVRTSGIVTEKYVIDGTTFEMYDVGGQRNERKKWIHCFEGVTAVIFVAAISEYDQKLFEDSSTNRMIEALALFEDIAKNEFFLKSSLILFLNKVDLFGEKVKQFPIKDAFPDYVGKEGDAKAGAEYFTKAFMARNKVAGRVVYSHLTCATDTKNVRVVFDACKDIILRENLKNSGFMD